MMAPAHADVFKWEHLPFPKSLMFSLTSAGIDCFDLHTRKGSYAGLISLTKRGDWRVFFNMTATKGSNRRFATAEAAVKFIYDRRIKKGWGG